MHTYRSAFAWLVAVVLTQMLNSTPAIAIKPTDVTAKSGISYRIFSQSSLSLRFETRRPRESDTRIELCVPAAFTTHDNKIDGVYVVDGAVFNASATNAQLGGALVVIDGHAKGVATESGALLSKDVLNRITEKQGSLFQQFLIVQDGKAATFKDKSKFQRRAIVEFRNGDGVAVVESTTAIPFTTFNADLVELGAQQAIYTDMGAWDEGWYRDPNGRIETIGLDKSLTNRQSNWVTFVSTPEKSPTAPDFDTLFKNAQKSTAGWHISQSMRELAVISALLLTLGGSFALHFLGNKRHSGK